MIIDIKSNYEIKIQVDENESNAHIITGQELASLAHCYCMTKHNYASYVPLNEGGGILNEKRFDLFLQSKAPFES